MTNDPTERWPYPGARWWKFDFHAQTPASANHGKGASQLRQITPQDWLLGFMGAGVDCVAVTDHNSGDWLDRLGAAAQQLEQSGHPGFRPLTLFPGVEITANGGIHILAVLSTACGSADVQKLLGAVGYRGQSGASDVAASASAIDVVAAICAAGGIPILAHVDGPSGAWQLPDNTLAPLLDAQGLFAMEVVGSNAKPPELYRQRKLNWAQVHGSDSCDTTGGEAHQRLPGSHFTWVKMGTPCLEGLRLALLDGSGFSIRRSDEPGDFQPFAVPPLWIESIDIEDAQYMGRGAPARLAFNPRLNALVGGRGTGKSTVIHALRLAARRWQELASLDEQSEPQRTFRRFNRVPAGHNKEGGLTDATSIRCTLLRDRLRYRLHWRQDAAGVVVEEESGGKWRPSEVQSVSLERFPVRLFSQGQIAALAGDNQQALLQVIDEAAGVHAIRSELEAAGDAYYALQARVRNLEGRLRQRDDLLVKREDVERKLKRFEEAGHAAVLKAYRRFNLQQGEVDRQFDDALAMADRIDASAEDLLLSDAPAGRFDDSALDRDASNAIAALAVAVDGAADTLRAAARLLREKIEQQRGELSASAWRLAVQDATQSYAKLVAVLREEGVSDPNEYGHLAQNRQLLDDELAQLDSLAEERDRLVAESPTLLGKVQDARRAVTAARREFLAGTLAQNPFVRIATCAYGTDPRSIERSLRESLQTQDHFEGDFLQLEEGVATGGCVAELLEELPGNEPERAAQLEQRIRVLKERIRRCAAGEPTSFSGFLKNHLAKKLQEQPAIFDNVDAWFPEDGLVVEYSRDDGEDFRPIEQASAGQRAAAMLAFLLSHGDEPLVLDQPEDDLDNHLIYDLVVRQIRENKLRRQIIVVTHNPNIVVNGDAEMLHALAFQGGQCVVAQFGPLQDASMREEVCRIMEGGRHAFERRYKRLGRS